MKLEFKNKIIALFVVGGLVLSSCTDGFEEVNRDPNGPIAVPSGLLMPTLIEATSDRLFDTFHGGDMETWIQHWGKVQYNDEERYAPRSGVINSVWNGFYAGGAELTDNTGGGGIVDAYEMANLAVSEGNDKHLGVALIFQAYLFSLITEMYGPIPFTEAIQAKSGNTTPAYDDQETVLRGCVALLDSAVSALAGSGAIDGATDILYGGNTSSWMKFANSLKFRMLMRMSNKVDVAAQLQAIVSGGVHFTSNSDNAQLNYLGSNPNANPVYYDVVFSTRSEWKINETTVTLMGDLNDPRLAVYAQENDGGIIRGVPRGVLNPTLVGYDYVNTSALGEYFLDPSSPGVFMSYSELMFLVAEAAKKGLITGGDATAQSAYEAGIVASFDTYNGYVNGDGSLVSLNAAAYLVSGGVSYSTASALTQIATQNYIALYGQGQEAYSEWRRTKLPALLPAIDALNGLTSIPSRYLYPSDEQSLNTTNYNDAATMVGGDELDTKLWFMN
ncbi:MAG: hypothetical protein ACJA08_001627 [Cyclobacteriaceae bacterium]|jgi:hypothetical protein